MDEREVVDLSALPTARTASGQDLGEALRAALETSGERSDDLEVALAGIGDRARQRHRHRLAATGAGAVAVAAVVAGVVVLGGLPGGAHPTHVTPAGPTRTTTSSPPAVPSAAPLSAASVLRPDDVTAFGRSVSQSGASVGDGTEASSGACGGTSLVPEPSGSARTALTAAMTAEGTAPSGLVEQVWRFNDATAASTSYEALAQRATSCTGAQSEGVSAAQPIDAASVAPSGGSAVATTSTDGNGDRELLVLQLSGSTVVELDLTWDRTAAGAPRDGAAAVSAAASTARAAVERATS